MKLAWVVAGGVDRSGRERIVPTLVALVRELAQRHQLHVFSLAHESSPGRYILEGAQVHELGGRDVVRGTGLLRLGPRLLRALRAAGAFDLIHGYMGIPSGVLAAFAGRLLRAPSVVTLDSGELTRIPDIGYGLQLSFRHRVLVGLCLKLASRVTVASGGMRELARRQGRDTEQVPFGVDLSRFTPRPSEPPGPPWRLLHVASRSPVKDQATLLRAMRRVAARISSVELEIVGVDTMGGQLERLCAELGLTERVRFHGQRRNDELPALYARAHLHLASSRHEAGGYAVLEAAATGVPTVGTAVGHVADLAPELALAVAVGDDAALAEAVVFLLSDGERRRRIGEAARAWARRHDAAWTARRLEEIYAGLRSATGA